MPVLGATRNPVATTITLPPGLEAQLQEQAAANEQSVEDVALALLREAVEARAASTEVGVVVARIVAMPPSQNGLRAARGSLVDSLRAEPEAKDEQGHLRWDAA